MSNLNSEAWHELRKWIGAGVIAIVSLVAALPMVQQKAAVELWVGLFAFVVIGIGLMWPVKARQRVRAPQTEHEQTAFIRGNVRRSTIARVRSDADVFIDGHVRDAHIYDIIFRGWKKA